jgi:prefoldin subunit 5
MIASLDPALLTSIGGLITAIGGIGLGFYIQTHKADQTTVESLGKELKRVNARLDQCEQSRDELREEIKQLKGRK